MQFQTGLFRIGPPRISRLAVLALALSVVTLPQARAEAVPPAAPPATPAGQPPGSSGAAMPLPPPAAPAPAINGFRSARFGMTEDEVRAAIARDFHLPPSAVQASQNAIERTAILTARVTDLAPGTGGAIISYVFGFRSHRLIEVNIIWSKASDAHLTPEQLWVIGGRLQAYFSGEGFAPARTALNLPLDDGILLFRTADPAGHAIGLILSGPIRNDAKSGKRVLTPTALSLAYVVDAAHPDVFRLEKGSF